METGVLLSYLELSLEPRERVFRISTVIYLKESL